VWVLGGMGSEHPLERFEAFRRQYSEGAEEGTCQQCANSAKRGKTRKY